MIFSVLAFVPFLLAGTHALYGSKSDVIELTPANFNSEVLDSDDLWLVEFFAPWCGHCQALVSEYSKVASALKGIVKVGAVDADQHKTLGHQFGIKGFPTIKIFGSNKDKPRDYTGARTSQGIVDGAFKELKRMVEGKLSGEKAGGDSDRSKKEADPKDVIELTDSNFKETVIDSPDMWLVEFYAPWCGHCKSLAPHWAEAATELKGKVKLGAIDATVNSIMGRKYDIKGFPTIKYFPAGKKDGSAEEYGGGRTAQDIISWALEKAADNIPPPEVVQITSAQILEETCEKHPLCVISILPHILDCQSECRNNYIKILREVGDRYRRTGWGWGWAEALAQTNLEDALGIGGFGYPAMAVVNARKMKYSILRGPFSSDGISEFVRTVSAGRGSSAPVKGAKMPEIVATEPWDGKDGQLPVEEEIDVSDVELDEPATPPESEHTEL